MSDKPILAIDKWASNAELIADCARLGYLDGSVLDPTYGLGTFWNIYSPAMFTASDLDPSKSPSGESVDFTALPWDRCSFDAVVFDPPYKLNGTPTGGVGDERYGVHEYTRWQDRMTLILDGAKECARVADKHLLVKCQDQVVGGKIRWQSYAITAVVESLGFGLKDRLDFLSYRPQPAGRAQNNAHRCSSQMLVFKRGWKWSDF